MTETCNATDRERSKLHICELTLHHAGDHRDGEHTWPQANRRGEREVIL